MDPLVGAEGPAGVTGAVGGVPGGVQGGYHILPGRRPGRAGKGLNVLSIGLTREGFAVALSV